MASKKKKKKFSEQVISGTYESSMTKEKVGSALKSNSRSVADAYKQYKKTEDTSGSMFSAFDDGYDVGDITKSLLKGTSKLADTIFNTGKEIVTNPIESIKTGGVGIASGIDRADTLINNATDDFFDWIVPGRKEKDKGMTLKEFNQLSSATDEKTKKKLLEEYAEKYGKDSSTYKTIELQLQTEPRDTGTYQDTETYKKAQAGELSEGQQNLYGVGENIGAMLPSVGVSIVAGPGAGSTVFFTQAQQGYTEEAKERGYSDTEARTYGLIMGGAEVLVERLGFDELGGLQKLSNSSIKKAMVGEGLEEFVMPYVDDVVTYGIYEDGYSWEEFGESTEEALEGAVMGATVGAIMNGGGRGLQKVDNVINKINTGQEITQEDLVEAGKELQENAPELLEEAMKGVPEVVRQELEKQKANQVTTDDVAIADESINVLPGTEQEEIAPVGEDVVQQLEQDNIPIIEDNQVQQAGQQDIAPVEMPQQETQQVSEAELKKRNYTYVASETDSQITRELKESASRVMNDTKRSHEFVETVSKIAERTQTKYRFTNTEEINALGYGVEGKRVNGLVTKDGEILVNIDSQRALNTIIGHETTHLLEGTKEYQALQDAVFKYASEKGDFEAESDRISRIYTGQKNVNLNNELTSELIGNYLFTDQQFLDSLTAEQPSVVRKIYNEIKHWFKMATAGSKEARQLEDLKYRFEKALSKQSENKQAAVNETKQATTQETKDNSIVEAESNTVEKTESVQEVEDATKTEEFSLNEDNKGRELSEEQIEFFKDSVVRDENGNLLTMYHGTRADFNVFESDRAGQNYEDNWSRAGRGHYFTPDIKYAKDYGEASIEKGPVKIKEVYLNITKPFDMSTDYSETLTDMKNEYNIDDFYLKVGYRLIDWFKSQNIDSTEVLKKNGFDGIHDFEDYIAFESNQIKDVDNTNPTENEDIRYSLSDKTDAEVRESLLDSRNDISEQAIKKMREYIAEQRPDFFNKGTDNLGRKLSPGMQEYMKDSKARDVNDSLSTVYHTTTDEVVQFNEFNPVGTDYYRFGDQVVNYYTDSKVMSGSYADQDYKIANTRTKKFESIEEANKYIDEFNKNNNDNFEIVENEEGYLLMRGNATYQEYNSKNLLLRSVNDDISNIVNEKSNYQYEGYVNITNPYVVDAEGRSWGQVQSGIEPKITEQLNRITKIEKEALSQLANESVEQYKENWTQDLADEYFIYRQAYYKLSETEAEQVVLNKLGVELKNPGKEIYLDGYIGNSRYQWTETLKDFAIKYNQLAEDYNLYHNESSYFKANYKNMINTNKIEDINSEELFSIAYQDFREAFYDDIFAKDKTTNDIVHQVIDMNKNGSNYDGVIINNVVDYGGKANGDYSPANLYVTFNSEQFKAWDNENPTSDPDIRYSLSNEKEYYYRGQEADGDKIAFNSTGFMGDSEGGVYFTTNENTASKYGKNVIKLEKTPENTVSVEESDRLQEWATKIVEADIRKGQETEYIIEQMALGRPRAFAEYTKKPFVETGDLFGEENEAIYYEEVANGTSQYGNFDDDYSLSNPEEDIAPVGDYNVYGNEVGLQQQVEEAIAPLQEQVEELTKVITDLQENIAPASFESAEEQRAETQRTMSDEDAPLTEEGTFNFLNEVPIEVKNKRDITYDIQDAFNIKHTEAREIYNKIASMPELTVEDIYAELENHKNVKMQMEDDYYKDIQNYIKGTKLDVSEIKKQIPDYSNTFRMANMGKGLTLGNSGQSIDSFYQELNELYPNVFPDSVTAEADQLDLISQVMFRDTNLTYTETIDDDTLQILSEKLYSEIGNRERYKSAEAHVTNWFRHYKDMLAPGEEAPIKTDITQEEYLKSLPDTLEEDYAPYLEQAREVNASNTEQTSEMASIMEELNRLDTEKAQEVNVAENEPTIAKNPMDEMLDNFIDRLRGNKAKTPAQRVEKSKMRNAIDTGKRLFVNEMAETDNLAHKTGNLNIKYKGDMLNAVAGEIEGEIYAAQTNNEGKEIGFALSELFAEAKQTGLYEPFNHYLELQSNIDRHKQGKGSKIPLTESEQLVKAYEQQYPEFREWGEGVWYYGENILNNLADAGLVSQQTVRKLREMYPHYVPYIENRDVSNYYPDLGEMKATSVIKRAKGGASDLLPIEEALTKYTFASKKAVRQNQFYQELVSTLDDKVSIGADVRSDATDLETSLYRDETGNYLTAYFNGQQQSVRISDDLYTGLKNDLSHQIKALEDKFAIVTDPVQKLSEIRRNLLTSWNPMFIIRNPIMDVQDAVFNSKYTKDFVKNYPGAFVELARANTDTAKQFLSLYGSGNVMGEHTADGTVKNGKFLKGIQKANNIVELAPRYAEFKASIENGASIEEAMYNAREITTNFSRGGTITKALNKNGFTFLNVSVQGFDKFIRNFSGENGAVGVAGALLKATMLGVLPAVFNELAFGGDDDEEKDEDYDALPDYIKDNYYLIKTGDGEFIRIPKGRILSVFGSAARRTLEYLQGEEDAFEGFLKNANSQVGVSNPLDSNILTPLFQAFGSENGEAWYGGDIVPSRLQDKAPEEQYDASTDKFSIWLGDKLGVSPYKINYVLDQYSGGIGDIFLPMITDEATNDVEGPGVLLAPIKDAFTSNSTFDNKYASEIYTLSDKMDKMPTATKETDEYKIQDSYLYSVTSEMASLYAERREVQADKTLSKSEKYEKVQSIQQQINSLAKEGLDNYQYVSKTDNYAIVGGREFNKYTTESGEERWGKVYDDVLDDMNSMGMDLEEKSEYFKATSTISATQNSYEGSNDYVNKKRDVISIIKDTNLNDEQKAYLYDKYYGNTEVVNAMVTLGVDMDSYLDYESQNFEADKDSNGKSISGSKKAKVFSYINSMNIDFEQRVILAKLQYNSYNQYNAEIIEYLNNSDLTYEEEVVFLKKLGFEVDDYGNIRW